ncbi:MAG: hypothetical protein ACOZIN_16570 [Myxococcota bacterium]
MKYPLSAGRLQRNPQPIVVNGVALSELKPKTPIDQAMLEKLIERMEREPRFGKTGALAFREAHRQAQTTSGRVPTLSEVQQQVGRALRSLENERAKGRVNDGYVDKREAAAIKNPLAGAIHEWLSTVSEMPRTSAAELRARATAAQLGQALKTLESVTDEAFKLFGRKGDYGDLTKAVREACRAAKVSSQGVSALLIAVNGKTSRGDNGTLETPPKAAEVKQALRSAVSKLKTADGAQIVDFRHPEAKPTAKRDGVITGLEVDRTPGVTGKAARALLRYASTL